MGSIRRQPPRRARSAGSPALLTVLLGTAVAVACGGTSNDSLFDEVPAAGRGGATSGGSAGKGGTGGGSTGGSATGGSGGASAGTSNGGSGGSGGDVMTGGSSSGGAGGAPGGMGGDVSSGGVGGDVAGTGGDLSAGGTGGDLGGSGGDATTGGAAGTPMGGSGGNATAGAAGNAMGGTAGAAAGSGGTGGKGGAGGKGNCDELQQAAEQALTQAQVCSLAVNGKQCVAFVDDLCGCSVPVNSADSEATKRYLAAAEAAQGCTFVCSAVLCVEPGNATCVRTMAGGSAGRCRAGLVATPL